MYKYIEGPEEELLRLPDSEHGRVRDRLHIFTLCSATSYSCKFVWEGFVCLFLLVSILWGFPQTVMLSETKTVLVRSGTSERWIFRATSLSCERRGGGSPPTPA